MSGLKRGGYARDRRIGTYVRIAEQGMDGASWMVRPAYRSDGYWAATADLEPSADPHAWTGREMVKFVVCVAVSMLCAWGVATRMAHAGLEAGEAISYSTGVAYTVGAGMALLTGLRRP